jgi:hypothetical protein
MADLTITVKSLDGQSLELALSSATLVRDLKGVLEERWEVPAARQRLLYRAQMLEDAQPLSTYGVQTGGVISLVSSLQREQGEEGEQNDPLADILRLVSGSPAALISRRPRRQPARRDITEAERVEAMRQNLLTLQSLLDTRNRAPPEGDQLLGFDYGRRTLTKGMWVDVKDTVDQWLEAQIIDVRATASGTSVFVHYNGWPSRWDEWIDAQSSRIQPLRAKTFQSISAPMHSPYPVVTPDPPEAIPPPQQDLNETATQTSRFIGQTKAMMERYYLLQTIMKHERAVVERVQPMQDRLSMMQRTGGVVEERKTAAAANRRYEEHMYPPSDSSEAVAGSEDFSDSMSIEEEEAQDWDHPALTTEQEFNLLSVQMAPILDRFGRLLCDLGVTIAKEVNQQMGQRGDFPAAATMPTPAELYALSGNQYGPEPGMQIALFTLRSRSEGNRDSAT